MSRSHSLILGLGLIALVGASAVQAKNITLELKSSQVSSYNTEDDAFYHVLTFDVPEDVIGKRLDSVILEFYIDASLKPGVAEENSAVIEVRSLSESFSGRGVPSFVSVYPGARHILIGDGKRVALDITDIVKVWIATPSKNHGLIIGSFAGSRDGVFELRSDVLRSGVFATVTFFYQNRFNS